jgi:small subunit ribosomal protein S18
MPKRTFTPVRKRRKALLAPDVTYVDYKDVALLRAFISDRGKIRARRVTGLTPQQQRAVTKAIKNAREVALLPYTNHQ